MIPEKLWFLRWWLGQINLTTHGVNSSIPSNWFNFVTRSSYDARFVDVVVERQRVPLRTQKLGCIEKLNELVNSFKAKKSSVYLLADDVSDQQFTQDVKEACSDSSATLRLMVRTIARQWGSPARGFVQSQDNKAVRHMVSKNLKTMRQADTWFRKIARQWGSLEKAIWVRLGAILLLLIKF